MVMTEPPDPAPPQFFLAHIVFDEEHGPVLKSYKAHELEIPRIVLQGVTTTLFTMAIGVGEPTGEPDTAIIPINVTGIQGRVLIHSFAIKDSKARGKNRIESFMLFIPREHQDKLLQHSLAFSAILQEAIHNIEIKNDGVEVIYQFENVYENIKKVLLTRIDNKIQDIISEVCTEKESVLVSDGSIRAVHNILLSPEIISIVNQIPSLLYDYAHELKSVGTFFDSLPIEIHGKTYSDHQFYLIAIGTNYVLAFSSGKGRLGSLFRIFRELLWDLNMQSNEGSRTHISPYRMSISTISNSFPENTYLNTTFDLLKSFEPILTDFSILRCSCDRKKVEALRKTSDQSVKKHALICYIFNTIHGLSSRLFRTSLMQIVLSQHGFNSIALMWATNSLQNVRLFMVADSTRSVGLLKLVSEQVLEYRVNSISQST